jgi:hypothetical protein
MSDYALANHPDTLILRNNSYAKYANLPDAFKTKLEPALLVEIIDSLNLDLDSKYLNVEVWTLD